jgi:hypothetical protein
MGLMDRLFPYLLWAQKDLSVQMVQMVQRIQKVQRIQMAQKTQKDLSAHRVPLCQWNLLVLWILTDPLYQWRLHDLLIRLVPYFLDLLSDQKDPMDLKDPTDPKDLTAQKDQMAQ